MSDVHDAAAAPIRVAIVGGGCAGVAAAFWLSVPELAGQYKVTLFTQGWRLGGKGASGRSRNPPQVITEHGLHLWLGCYYNAFHMMRRCYEVYAPAPPDGAVPNPYLKAFLPVSDLVLAEPDPDKPSGWLFWPCHIECPGSEPGRDALPSFKDLVVSLANWLRGLIDARLSDHIEKPQYQDALDSLRQAAGPNLHGGEGSVASQKLRAVNAELVTSINALFNINFDDKVDLGIGRTVRGAQFDPRLATNFADFELAAPDQLDLRHAAILANLGLAASTGLAGQVLSAPDIDAAISTLNASDFRDWLSACGAADWAVKSAPVRALYDLAFAYPDGDTTQPGGLSAGIAIRTVLEMGFASVGAPFWKMVSGMGDAVFEPLYKVLLKQNVSIEFFHRLLAVEQRVLGRQHSIASLTFLRQATLAGGSATYNPFIPVGSRDCWPNEPNWEQLVNGAAMQQNGVDFEDVGDSTGDQVQFRFGDDGQFDIVVLAIPPEALKRAAGDLTFPDWQAMLGNSHSICTQSCQFWLKPAARDMGWPYPTPLTAYAQPFSTWADMSHLLNVEQWPGPNKPGSVFYFCGPLSVPVQGMAPGPLVPAKIADWLDANATTLWPKTAWDPSIVLKEYTRSNDQPTEQYVQIPPGSVQYRLPPDWRGYDNLFLAGDWTLTRNSGGCVENAVESGLTAARAISGVPTLGA